MEWIVQIPLGMKVMGNNRLGNFFRGIIFLGKTSRLREFLKPHLQRFLQFSISTILRIHHRIGDDSNIFMEKPMIFFLLHFAKEPLCFFRRVDFPPNSCSMEVISMKKKENWIFGVRVLEKIFWQDDEKTLLLIQ
jgi:hypothetical protein